MVLHWTLVGDDQVDMKINQTRENCPPRDIDHVYVVLRLDTPMCRSYSCNLSLLHYYYPISDRLGLGPEKYVAAADEGYHGRILLFSLCPRTLGLL
jgi:hypothetical protein